MNDAVARMLDRYELRSTQDYTRALREVFQELSLLGLWRAKFFEHSAFYGDTALRILHGLDRFSEDLDFSLLTPDAHFDLGRYLAGLERELAAFGLTVSVTPKPKATRSAVQSAFLKAGTLEHLLVIGAGAALTRGVPGNQMIKVKLEVDRDPPGGFDTQTHFLLRPLPFSVRAYTLPDLFAGKMHALLFRRWKNRVKGRDWYDLVWFAAHHPALHLAHLEQRMRQSGDWTAEAALDEAKFGDLFAQVVGNLDVTRAARDVEPFLRRPESLEVWSREFFLDIGRRIEIV
ncbi:MAG: nucleotidyl transferase AbiEii/AbiGii toxin family protein [Thermoleophilia bacterium]